MRRVEEISQRKMLRITATALGSDCWWLEPVMRVLPYCMPACAFVPSVAWVRHVALGEAAAPTRRKLRYGTVRCAHLAHRAHLVASLSQRTRIHDMIDGEK